jgi:hypothetical protein
MMKRTRRPHPSLHGMTSDQPGGAFFNALQRDSIDTRYAPQDLGSNIRKNVQMTAYHFKVAMSIYEYF